MPLDESSQPTVRDDLVFRQVDDDFFVYDPVWDRVALLNVSAAVVFDLCDGSRTPLEIAAEVARAFDTDGPEVIDRVRETLDELAASGLLGNPPSPG